VYERRIQAQLIGELLEPLFTSPPLHTDEIDASIDRFLATFVRLACHLKNPAFHEEDEWRLVSEPLSIDDPAIGFREGSSLVIPYYQLALASPKLPLEFACMTIGPTAHHELALSGLSGLVRRHQVKYGYLGLAQVPFRSW
jgi:hypothetical protein